jgi:hypothetical protein
VNDTVKTIVITALTIVLIAFALGTLVTHHSDNRIDRPHDYEPGTTERKSSENIHAYAEQKEPEYISLAEFRALSRSKQIEVVEHALGKASLALGADKFMRCDLAKGTEKMRLTMEEYYDKYLKPRSADKNATDYAVGFMLWWCRI